MKRILFLLFLLTSTYSILQAEDMDYSRIDSYAKIAVPSHLEKNLDLLVPYLIRPAHNDFEKVRSLFTWIATNIAYDTEYLFNQENREACVSESCILEKRKSICAGYARLFQQMCLKAGIRNEIIEGYAKGFDYRADKRFDRSNHAWNAFQINGKWYLADVTWASGVITPERTFRKKYNSGYFMVLPEAFVLEHLPLDPIWQLLKAPVPMSTFEQNADAISAYIAKTPERMDFDHAISLQESLPAAERNFRSMERAHKFNPNNSFDYAFACMHYADILSDQNRLAGMEDDQRTQSIRIAFAKYDEAYLNFRKMEDEISRHNVLYCKDRIEDLKFKSASQNNLIASNR